MPSVKRFDLKGWNRTAKKPGERSKPLSAIWLSSPMMLFDVSLEKVGERNEKAKPRLSSLPIAPGL